MTIRLFLKGMIVFLLVAGPSYLAKWFKLWKIIN